MNGIAEMIIEAQALVNGRRLRNADVAEVAARVREVKERFLANREVFQEMANEENPNMMNALKAGADMFALSVRDVLALVKHPDTQACPIADDINATFDELAGKAEDVLMRAPGALLRQDTADWIGDIIKLVETLETLVVKQLALVHRERVPDYFAGLDREAPFPAFRYNAANRGRVSRLADSGAAATKLWDNKIGGLIWGSPVVDKNGDIYIGHAVGEFVALTADGKEKWRIADEQMMYIDSSGGLGIDGYLYMASTDCDKRGHQNQGRIWKIDPETGKVIWTFWGKHFEDPENNPDAHLSSFFEGHLTLGEENGKVTIYAGSDDNHLYKLDSDGNLVWDYFTETYPSGVIWTKPLLSPDGRTVFVGELSGMVHAVDTATSRARWRTRLGGSVVSSLAMGMYGELFMGCFDGRVYALAPEDGTEFWSYQTLGLVYSSPAVARNGDLVIGSTDGAVYRLDRFGRRVWSYYTDAPVKSSPVIDPDGLIYVGNENGKMYCLSPDGRRVWSYHTNPGVTENDINSSPSLGPGGAVFFGSTTGQVFAIPGDYYYTNRKDKLLELNPNHDGEKPDIPPGGATVVYMDRNGTPQFEPPQALEISDYLNLAFFAVDDNVDVVPAELDKESVAVEIMPELPHEMRVESMGRFIYIVPGDFMEYDTEYTIRARGRYTAEDRVKEFDASVTVRTAKRPRKRKMPLEIRDDSVDGVFTDGFIICQPKEIDALGQAMMDSQKFAVAPIYINRDNNVLALAICAMVETGGGYEYTPASVNKTVLCGTFKDSAFKAAGSMRLITQGANIPFDRFEMAGRFSDAPAIESGACYCQAAVSGVPDFAELIRVMKLADIHDDTVGFCTFKSLPLESDAVKKPAGLKVEASMQGNRIIASVEAKNYRADEHWLNVVILDADTGAVIPGNRVDVKTDASGVVTEISSDAPAAAQGKNAVAIIQTDLFPAAVVEL